jgi:hypothetical protein
VLRGHGVRRIASDPWRRVRDPGREPGHGHGLSFMSVIRFEWCGRPFGGSAVGPGGCAHGSVGLCLQGTREKAVLFSFMSLLLWRGSSEEGGGPSSRVRLLRPSLSVIGSQEEALGDPAHGWHLGALRASVYLVPPDPNLLFLLKVPRSLIQFPRFTLGNVLFRSSFPHSVPQIHP